VNRRSHSPAFYVPGFCCLPLCRLRRYWSPLSGPAQAYVDPGSGFVFLQVAGSMCAGAIYYLRHRVKRLLHSLRRSPAPTQTEVVENQP